MSGGRTFFRSFPADADPERLLDPDEQVTEPRWGHEPGPCDKCRGSGSAIYNCSSCLEAGSREYCPACQGRVHFIAVCPACLGEGRIDEIRRRGIAVFPTREGLYRYLAAKGAPCLEENVVVELEGALGDQLDLDADAGTLLIHPTHVVGVEPLDPHVVESIQRRGIASV